MFFADAKLMYLCFPYKGFVRVPTPPRRVLRGVFVAVQVRSLILRNPLHELRVQDDAVLKGTTSSGALQGTPTSHRAPPTEVQSGG